tara:strand:- start:2194 stop:4407 length:2214 start_codon:yes stop_codon:yes gene_type:complete
MANTVQDHFALASGKQRDAIIQSLIQQLNGVQSEKTVKAQWEAYISLQRNVRGLEKIIAEASQALQKEDAKYVQTLIKARETSFKARQDAYARTTGKKIDAEAEARKYNRKLAEKIEPKLTSASAKLREELPANIAESGKTKEQAIFRTLNAQVERAYKDLPADPIQRAMALDSIRADVLSVITKQTHWDTETVPNAQDLTDKYMNQLGGAGEKGVDYGFNVDGSIISGVLIEERSQSDVSKLSSGVLGDGGQFDLNQAIRLGGISGGKDPLARRISGAIFNKLSVDNPEALGDFNTVDDVHRFLTEGDTTDPRWEALVSAGRDVGNNVSELNKWNDSTIVGMLRDKKATEQRALGIKPIGKEEQDKSFGEIQREAQRLYVDMYGTRLERNTKERQRLLKEKFADETFFQMSYGNQKRVIDALPMSKKFKKEMKALIQGKSGALTASEEQSMFIRIDQMIDQTRDQGQIMPVELQEALQNQFEDRGLLVRTDPKFGQGKGKVSFQIGETLVPQGELRYEDLVGLVGKLVEEGSATPEQSEQLAKHLADYGQHSLTRSVASSDSLDALKAFAGVITQARPPLPAQMPTMPPSVSPEIAVLGDEATAPSVELDVLNDLTGGATTATDVTEQTQKNAQATGIGLATMAATESAINGGTVTKEVEGELLEKGMKPLTGHDLMPEVRSMFDTIAEVARLGDGASGVDIDEALGSIFGGEYSKNQMLKEQSQAVYHMFAGSQQ